MAYAGVPIAPAVLAWALDQSGLDADSARKRFPQLSAWLTGTGQPTFRQVETFADAVHVPFGMLFLPEPPAATSLPVPDMRTPGSRGVDTPSAELVEVIHACQRRQDWYRDYAQRTGLPPVGLVGEMVLTEDVEHAGERLRGMLRLDDAPAGADAVRRFLVSSLEDLGVLVMISGYVGNSTHRSLDPEEFRGFALADPVAPLVFVNGAEAKTAQNFTLVHESVHLSLGRSALSDARPDRDGPRDEAWCNAVAAAALVPRRDLPRFDPRDPESSRGRVRDTAGRIGVSPAVVLIRMRDTGLLSQADLDVEWGEVCRGGGTRGKRPANPGGDFYRTARYRFGAPFIRAVVNSAREGSTSYRDAFRLLGTHNPAVMDTMAERVIEA